MCGATSSTIKGKQSPEFLHSYLLHPKCSIPNMRPNQENANGYDVRFDPLVSAEICHLSLWTNEGVGWGYSSASWPYQGCHSLTFKVLERPYFLTEFSVALAFLIQNFSFQIKRWLKTNNKQTKNSKSIKVIIPLNLTDVECTLVIMRLFSNSGQMSLLHRNLSLWSKVHLNSHRQGAGMGHSC